MSSGERSSNNNEEADLLIAHIIKPGLEKVLCKHMPLYTRISDLFFEIIIKKVVQSDRSNLFLNH